ncbi:MAG: UDP-N-acetylglucosamine 2-epimerase (non-hydrolyzing) [Phycisphaera sp.]|nr:UDP-N-acetylglucosamine 2-epimerase (non-hydrolyzing) [Phycisphaera sp.]
MTRIAVFIGTRPEAIKMAPVIAALEKAEGFDPVVVSTGQHREMLQQVVDLFGITVDHDLAVMQPNQTLASLTSRLITRIDELLETVKPDMALVQGDTTTVLTAALTCFYRRIPIGHVEAGLRTGNIWSPFPEEVNRRLSSPIVTLHFPPTEFGRQNLLREGMDDRRIFVTGNTVIDALHMEVERQKQPAAQKVIEDKLASLLGSDWRDKPYVLITGHRRENFGGGFDNICDALRELATRFADHRFIYPVHLNPNVQKPVYERLGNRENIRLVPPQQYSEFVALMNSSKLVLTDSGGVQEEAPGLGKPVLVMRDTTERPEGVDAGTVRLIGANRDRIIDSVSELLSNKQTYRHMAEAVNPYGDGKASGRIIDALRGYFNLNP